MNSVKLKSTLFKQILIVVIVCLNINTGYSQQLKSKKKSTEVGTWQILKYDAKATFDGVKHSISRPLHWKGKDYIKFGGLIASTLALASLDNKTNSFFEKHHDNFPKVVRDAGWYFGSPQNYFMANAGLYGFGLFTKNENVRKTSVLIVSSSITSGFIQSVLKNSVGRGRPSAGEGNNYFKPFSKESKHHSFPSGHTVLSVTMAHSIAKQFENIWVKVGIYTLGSIAPISRLVDNAHWLSDIGFSAITSIIVVDCIDKFLFTQEKYSYNKKPKLVQWNLKIGSNQIGVIGSF